MGAPSGRVVANQQSITHPLLSLTVMHQCLHIAEIVANVCEQIREVTCHDSTRPVVMFYQETPRSTLLALALTSKSFLEPALDTLWKFQDSLLPILKTLPSDSCKFEDGAKL